MRIIITTVKFYNLTGEPLNPTATALAHQHFDRENLLEIVHLLASHILYISDCTHSEGATSPLVACPQLNLPVIEGSALGLSPAEQIICEFFTPNRDGYCPISLDAQFRVRNARNKYFKTNSEEFIFQCEASVGLGRNITLYYYLFSPLGDRLSTGDLTLEGTSIYSEGCRLTGFIGCVRENKYLDSTHLQHVDIETQHIDHFYR